MINIKLVRETAGRLLEGLPKTLTYHSYEHTCAVVESCLEIANHENVTNPEDLLILETAAWFHDSGFLRSYLEHEIASCTIVTEYLPELGGTEKEIARVRELIMATRIPQQPVNHLGFIICDADLDYLGRSEFDRISKKLMEEWFHYRNLESEDAFIQAEISFLTQHRYFTDFSQENREPVKRAHLKKLMQYYRQKLTA